MVWHVTTVSDSIFLRSLAFSPFGCVVSVWKLDLYPARLSSIWGLGVFLKYMSEADLLTPLFIMISWGCCSYPGKTKSVFTRNTPLDLSVGGSCWSVLTLSLPPCYRALFSDGNVGQSLQLQGDSQESYFESVFIRDLSREKFLRWAWLRLSFVTLTLLQAITYGKWTGKQWSTDILCHCSNIHQISVIKPWGFMRGVQIFWFSSLLIWH